MEVDQAGECIEAERIGCESRFKAPSCFDTFFARGVHLSPQRPQSRTDRVALLLLLFGVVFLQNPKTFIPVAAVDERLCCEEQETRSSEEFARLDEVEGATVLSGSTKSAGEEENIFTVACHGNEFVCEEYRRVCEDSVFERSPDDFSEFFQVTHLLISGFGVMDSPHSSQVGCFVGPKRCRAQIRNSNNRDRTWVKGDHKKLSQPREEMGLDGGTIPSRSDLLRRSSWRLTSRDHSKSTRGGAIDGPVEKQKQNAAEQKDRAISGWSSCSLTGEDLIGAKGAVVVDGLGRFFLRDSVIEFLAPADTEKFDSEVRRNMRKGGAFDNLVSLRDVFVVVLARNPVTGGAPFVCPVTGLESNGPHEFVALRPCGHVVSSRALSELKKTVQSSCTVAAAAAAASPQLCSCPVCGKPFRRGCDVVVINADGDPDISKRNSESLEIWKAEQREECKAKKKKKSPKEPSEGQPVEKKRKV